MMIPDKTTLAKLLKEIKETENKKLENSKSCEEKGIGKSLVRSNQKMLKAYIQFTG